MNKFIIFPVIFSFVLSANAGISDSIFGNLFLGLPLNDSIELFIKSKSEYKFEPSQSIAPAPGGGIKITMYTTKSPIIHPSFKETQGELMIQKVEFEDSTHYSISILLTVASLFDQAFFYDSLATLFESYSHKTTNTVVVDKKGIDLERHTNFIFDKTHKNFIVNMFSDRERDRNKKYYLRIVCLFK